MFKFLQHATVQFLLEEDGPTAVEYAVILGLIAVAVVGSVSTMAEATKDSFLASGEAIVGAFAN